MKSQHFGEGLARSRSSGVGRFTVLVLIASLAAFVLWLLGTAAASVGFEQRMRPRPPNHRAYSRLFLARLLLTIESWRPVLDEILAAVGDARVWVASHHAALVLD